MREPDCARVGEGGAITLAGAIGNAVNDALKELGAEIAQAPITSRRVLAAIEAAGEASGGVTRYGRAARWPVSIRTYCARTSDSGLAMRAALMRPRMAATEAKPRSASQSSTPPTIFSR